MTKNPIINGKVAIEIAGCISNNIPKMAFKIPPVKYHPQPSSSFLLFNEKIISAIPENKNEILNTKESAKKDVTGVDIT